MIDNLRKLYMAILSYYFLTGKLAGEYRRTASDSGDFSIKKDQNDRVKVNLHGNSKIFLIDSLQDRWTVKELPENLYIDFLKSNKTSLDVFDYKSISMYEVTKKSNDQLQMSGSASQNEITISA